jgi:hypothetical protein
MHRSCRRKIDIRAVVCTQITHKIVYLTVERGTNIVEPPHRPSGDNDQFLAEDLLLVDFGVMDRAAYECAFEPMPEHRFDEFAGRASSEFQIDLG